MKTKQGLFLGFGLVGALLLACGGGCYVLIWPMFKEVSPAKRSAEAFLALLAQGKNAEAYASGATTLRSLQDRAMFDAAVKTLGLDGYASISWTSFNITNNSVATLNGTITTKTSGTIPIVATLVKEGDWKVQGISLQGAAPASAPPAVSKPTKPVPSDEASRKLASDTLRIFAAAVQTKDFTALHKEIAVLWQAEVSPEKLQSMFQEFIDKNIDLSGVNGVQPVFSDPPALDEHEWLILKGYFPTKPSRVKFDLKYAYEHPNWKLVGLNVTVAGE